MRKTAFAAASFATALMLAAGTAAAAKDQKNNRGYVVGSSGVARLADGGQPGGETAQSDQTAQADTASGRLTIKTKSSPPVMEPIGVNEPGINAPAMKVDSGAPQRIPADAAAARHQPPAATRSETEASLPPVSPHDPFADAAQRGIEKKDIRRGAAIPPQPVNR